MGIHVLYLVKYHNDQKAAMIAKSEMRDRAEVHRKAISDFGGRPIAQYGSYGEWDMVYIYEMPDQTALAANLHLTDSFGLAKECKAIPLMDMDDFIESFDLAITHDPQFLADGSEKVDIVRDNDHAALEVLRRADQCINSFHVQVIGRFVHDNDVRQLPSDDCKGYARLLTARQLAAGAQRHGAGHTKVAEMSTKFEVLIILLRLVRKGVDHIHQRRFRQFQLVNMVLRKCCNFKLTITKHIPLDGFQSLCVQQQVEKS